MIHTCPDPKSGFCMVSFDEKLHAEHLEKFEECRAVKGKFSSSSLFQGKNLDFSHFPLRFSLGFLLGAFWKNLVLFYWVFFGGFEEILWV